MSYLRVLCILVFVALSFADPQPKQLAGPPEEFTLYRIPDPVEAALNQKTAFLHTRFLKDGSQTLELPVDSEELFAFNFLTPTPRLYSLQLTDPNGKIVDLNSHLTKGVWPIGDGEDFELTAYTYVFEKPVRGKYSLQITAKGIGSRNLTADYPSVAIHLFNESPLQVFSHLMDYNNEKGNKIGLISYVTQQTTWAQGSRPSTMVGGDVTFAEMEVFTPDGKEVDVPMHDDGLHADGVAGDGIYGAFLVATQAGQYMANAVLEGVSPDGTPFIRSTEHIITVVDDPLELSGTATGVGNGNRIDIYLGVNRVTSNKYHAYAEVWGTNDQNQPIPVCWIASMLNPLTYQGQPAIKLELDLNWAARVNAKAPYTLKNVYVQDSNSFVPISQKSSINVDMKSPVNAIVSRILTKGIPEITEEMLNGVRPPMPVSNTTNACNLVLIHGYCAGSNPWQEHAPNDFTNACFFLFKDGNLLNDAYAMKVADYTKNLASFGGIGHSQGGLVFLHLHNYYWTGLENAKGKRLIQSVGSPYQGCSGAGSAANLIKIFGVACGANNDLTTDGAKLWLSGISANARKDVHYATTTYQQGKLFGDYCNIAVNLILQWPNDGTTETKYAELSGGNSLGNKEKWCHTTGMGYPPQYTDSARNKDFNANAAR